MAGDAAFVDDQLLDLSAWAGFPVTHVPRPVVLLAAPVHLGHGFVDGDSKSAWLSGSVVADIPLPAGLLELAREGHSEQPAPRVLHISSVEQCLAEYLCDRGPRWLPAYRLTGNGLRDGAVVLDPNLECWWPPRAQRSTAWSVTAHGNCARIEEDDRTIHFPAFGGVLTEFHHAHFVEYETCVVGQAITTQREAPPGTAVHLAGVGTEVTGRLEQPLAGRVLLNSHGHPIAVSRHTVDG